MSAQGVDLTWDGGKGTGSGKNNWDATTSNWNNNQTFSTGANVLFPQVGSSVSNVVNVTSLVQPGTLTVQGDSYSFTGSGGSIVASGQITIGSPLTLTQSVSSPALLSGTAGITVNNTGSLILSGSGNNIGDTTNVNLTGGSLISNGGAETLGALTFTTGSVLDFSSISSGASLTFASVGGTGTLNVYNFTLGVDHLFVNNTPTTGTINFYSGPSSSPGAPVAYNVEPVPEPSTIFGAIALVGAVGWRERRRLTGLAKLSLA